MARDAAYRKAISDAQIARRQREAAQQGPDPELKRCSRCGKWKHAKRDFTQLKRYRKSVGEVIERPAGACKECEAKRVAAKKAENPERWRRQQRRAWHKRKYKDGRDGVRLPVQPLAQFLDELIHRHGMSAVETASGVGERELRRIVDMEYDTVEARTADRILIGLNYPELMAILYPHA